MFTIAVDVAEMYVWLDVMSLNHHKEAMGSSFTTVKDCISSAKKVISASRTTVVLLDTWNAPAAWQRSWCLAEFLEARRLKRRVDFAFALDQRGNFVRALLKGYGNAEKAVLTAAVLRSERGVGAMAGEAEAAARTTMRHRRRPRRRRRAEPANPTRSSRTI